MLIVQHPEQPAFRVHVYEDRIGGRISVTTPQHEPFVFNHSNRQVVRTVGSLLVIAAEANHTSHPFHPRPIQTYDDKLRETVHRAIDRMSVSELCNLRLPLGAVL